MSNEPKIEKYFCTKEKCQKEHTSHYKRNGEWHESKVYKEHLQYKGIEDGADPREEVGYNKVDGPTVRICPECMGEGVGKRGEDKCGACNGTGTVEIGKELVLKKDIPGPWNDPDVQEGFKTGTEKIQKIVGRALDKKIGEEICNCQDPAHVKITDPGAPIPEASEIEDKENEEIWNEIGPDEQLPYRPPGITKTRSLVENIPDSVENGDEKKSLWDRLKSWWKK